MQQKTCFQNEFKPQVFVFELTVLRQDLGQQRICINDVFFFRLSCVQLLCGLQFSKATFWEHQQKTKVQGSECVLKKVQPETEAQVEEKTRHGNQEKTALLLL